MDNEVCYVCGLCWWIGCPNSADYTMHVDLKRNGFSIYSGKVDLCAGHCKQSERTDKMDLKWEAIEQAIVLEQIRS